MKNKNTMIYKHHTVYKKLREGDFFGRRAILSD